MNLIRKKRSRCMENNMINELFVQFNSLVDSLIEDFKEFNQNEEVLVFLAGKTKNFLDFTELTFLNVIFKFLSTLDTVNEGFSKEIEQSEELIKQIFDNIRGILDRIVIEDEEEEHGHSHGCGHSHGHEHHHHINMDGVQEDLDKIVDDLVFLKKLVATIGDIVFSSLKYKADEISQIEYEEEYKRFKDKIRKYCDEFDY